MTAARKAREKVLKTTRTEKEVSQQVVEAAAMLGIELKRRNVAAFVNPRGQMVRCGDPGDGDHYATLPGGRHLDLEIKEEGFDPRKLSPSKRPHFEEQLARLRRTNEQGGCGLWVRDSADFIAAMRRVLEGWRVEIDDEGFCWVTDEKLTGGLWP